MSPSLTSCFGYVCFEIKNLKQQNFWSNCMTTILKMVHPCIVSGCKNKAKDGIYRFPRDLELRRKWLSVRCS